MAYVLKLPKLSDTMEEGAIASWEKKEGDFVEEGDIILEIETDKATMEYGSPEEGYLLKILEKKGQTIPLGTPIAVLGKKDETFDLKKLVKKESETAKTEEPKKKSEQKDSSQKSDKTLAQQTQTKRIKASPLAKKRAKEQEIDLSRIVGSGPHGRIILKDLSAPKSSTSMLSQPSITRTIPLTMMRKTIAKRLLEAKNSAPHFYLELSCNMDRILSWREHLNQSHRVQKEQTAKISINDILIMVVAKALVKHPEVNASWDETQIIQHGNIHVAVAVALPTGLVTPVIRDANHLSIWEISKIAKTLIQKTRTAQIDPEEYTGGTFTISNLGMTRIEKFTAIINPPQAAILAVGCTKKYPVVSVDNKITIQNKMTITLSCDHRVIDGMVGAQFLTTLASFIEEPMMMIS